MGFPCGSAAKESTCNVGDLGSIPGLGRSPGEGNGHPLQYSGLENSMDCLVHGVAKRDTTEQLSLSFFYYGCPVLRTVSNSGLFKDITQKLEIGASELNLMHVI